MSLIEHIIRDIRDKETRREGETLDAYFKRTWGMALERYEREKPELPHVVEARVRTERLLAVVGRPEEDERN